MKAVSAQGSCTRQEDETAFSLFQSLLTGCTLSFHFSAIIYERLVWVFFKSEVTRASVNILAQVLLVSLVFCKT